MDNILSKFNFTKIDFLKIDIEGMELIALEGMYGTLKYTKYLMVEIQPENRIRLINALKGLNFRLIDHNNKNFLFRSKII